MKYKSHVLYKNFADDVKDIRGWVLFPPNVGYVKIVKMNEPDRYIPNGRVLMVETG